MEVRAELWAAGIDEWKRCDVSQRQYCEDNHLALATFSWWRTRLKQRGTRPDEVFAEVPIERVVSTSVGRGSGSLTIGRDTVNLGGQVSLLGLRCYAADSSTSSPFLNTRPSRTSSSCCQRVIRRHPFRASMMNRNDMARVAFLVPSPLVL
jgi:hypothetical protein